MDLYYRGRRRLYLGQIDPQKLATLSRLGLIVSAVLLGIAPLPLIADGYSFIEHTLSESGGQGVEVALVHRGGVLLASGSVFIMSLLSPNWNDGARRWLRLYALALVLLVMFPESSFDRGPYDPFVAKLHTGAGVTGAIGFILGIVAVSGSRLAFERNRRIFDRVVVTAVALIPQAMMFLDGDGVLQRVMVALGYIWLFLELSDVTSAGAEPQVKALPRTSSHYDVKLTRTSIQPRR